MYPLIWLSANAWVNSSSSGKWILECLRSMERSTLIFEEGLTGTISMDVLSSIKKTKSNWTKYVIKCINVSYDLAVCNCMGELFFQW